MPSNIFATTGTNVSAIFINKSLKRNSCLLVDASNLGKKIKDGKNQRTILTSLEIEKIISTFINTTIEDNFSVLVDYTDISNKNFYFNAGQYFDVKINYVDISYEEYVLKQKTMKNELNKVFLENEKLKKALMKQTEEMKYEEM